MDPWIDPRIALLDQFPGYDISELDHLVEYEGLKREYIPEPMRVLFETPSGFAIFGIDSGYLYDIGSDYTGTETIWVHCVDKESADMFAWLRGFLKLDSPKTAIAPEHIDDRLVDFIEELCNRGQKLVVGEVAYKEAIENYTGITCICDEAAQELMWGLQNLMHDLVPEEKSEFSKEDRKYHSKKLLEYLHYNDLDIKPEMIDGQIASFASYMRRCDVGCKEHSESLQSADFLLERAGLKTDHWDTVTHATALMALIGESVVMPDKMFTADEREKIRLNVGKHSEKIIKDSLQTVYKKAVRLHQAKFANRDKPVAALHKAEGALKGTPDSGEMSTESLKKSCQEAEGHKAEGALEGTRDSGEMLTESLKTSCQEAEGHKAEGALKGTRDSGEMWTESLKTSCQEAEGHKAEGALKGTRDSGEIFTESLKTSCQEAEGHGQRKKLKVDDE